LDYQDEPSIESDEHNSESQIFYDPPEYSEDDSTLQEFTALVQSFDLPRQALVSCLAATVDNDCPNSYEDVMRSPEKEEWKRAMDNEMD
jgi:hypothetical protein